LRAERLTTLKDVTHNFDEPFHQGQLDSHYGPEGPVVAALAWVQHILASDLSAAWKITDPNYRIVFAQGFIWANRAHPLLAGEDRDDLAASLAALSFDHRLWPSFADKTISEIQEVFRDFFEHPYGAASAPRPVALDYELVKFVATESFDEPEIISGPTFRRGQVFLMRSPTDGWLVSGLDIHEPPEPGWPPKVTRPTIP
jgi:hypothetical protein